MTEDDLKRARAIRGKQMAVVRESFIHQVAQAPIRRRLREALDPRREMQIGRELGQWLSGAVLGRRMTEEGLCSVLADGRFKTQAEIGSPNPTRPPSLERSVWTIEGDDPADLPIYGYAATIGDLRDPDGGLKSLESVRRAYGPVRVIFKNSVRSRTTFTIHDSLWRLKQLGVAPSRVTNPSHLSWPFDGDWNRERIDRCRADEYCEIQILGRVYVDDIDRVLFDRQPHQQTKEALGGVPYQVVG